MREKAQEFEPIINKFSIIVDEKTYRYQKQLNFCKINNLKKTAKNGGKEEDQNVINDNSIDFCANIIYNISAKVVYSLNTYQRLKELSEQNNGMLKTMDVVNAGISKSALAKYVKNQNLEKVCHGIYRDPDKWMDQMYLLQLRCPQTVFSHDTALFLHDLTDRDPLYYSVTAKTGYNPSHLSKEKIKVYTIKKDLFELGLSNIVTPFGNKVRVYDIERTICDIVRSRSTIEIQIFQDALKNYSRRRDKNLLRLEEYAIQFHVERIIRRYLEVLL